MCRVSDQLARRVQDSQGYIVRLDSGTARLTPSTQEAKAEAEAVVSLRVQSQLGLHSSKPARVTY